MVRGPDHPSIVRDIRRIAEIDLQLRTDGLNIPRMAVSWGVSARTVQRYLAIIRELIGETEAIEIPASGDNPRHFLQRYIGHAAQFFSHGC